MEEALSDFIRAESLLRGTPHDLYHTLTVSAQMVYEKMTRYANDPLAGFMVTAESYRKEGTKLRFGGQPGFSTTSVMFEKHKMDAINYTKHFMNPIASALCGFVEPHPIDTGTVQELDFQVRFPRINSMKLALNLHDC